MNSKTIVWLIAIATFASLAIPVQLFGQDHERNHHRYRLVDVGAFGGPDSYFTFGVGLNNRGEAAGAAATPTPDPFNPICIFPDCFVGHAFRWQDDVLTDLGALPGTNNSGVGGMNAHGTVAGVSENGLVDPVINFPDLEPVVWKNGQLIDLGTFGGNFGQANAINDRGQVAGFATNTISIPVSIAAFGCDVDLAVPTQTRAFIWEGGALKDLGTLGGTDSCAVLINQRGQVAGYSFTDFSANPPVHPFLWHHGTMLDLGTLGGTQGFTNALNNRGEVVGASSLAQNPDACTNAPTPGCHPFLWHRGRLIDLGTLGGDNGNAESLNDATEVVGEADLPGASGSQLHHAFLWRRGVMMDLGTQDGDPCSLALSINSRGQIVGASTDCSTYLHAFLWEKGGPMIDLNSFVPASSNLILTVATLISDRGEIAAQGVLPNGDTHAVLLVPCDEEHGDREGCEDQGAGAGVVRLALPSRSLSRSTRRPREWQRMSHLRVLHAGDKD
jgi:probable HAF family extracellular repeat protein